MQKSEFLDSFRQLLEKDPGPLTGEEPLTGIGWDSLAIVQFLAFTDEQFGVTVSPNRVRQCRTANDILALASSGNS